MTTTWRWDLYHGATLKASGTMDMADSADEGDAAAAGLYQAMTRENLTWAEIRTMRCVATDTADPTVTGEVDGTDWYADE